MAAGILPSIIYPDTARQAANRLLQAASSTDQSVQQCASLDTGTRASWGQFYVALVQFAKQDPGLFGLGTRMDRIEAYATELYAWQQKLQSAITTAGCTVTIPTYNPDTVSPGTQQAVQFMQYAFYAALALGGAYAIGKVVEGVEMFAPRRA